MLVDQFGRPIKKAKAPEKHTLAAAPIMDTWREYVASGLTPARLAEIFKEADAGNMRLQAELFEQMEEKDGHLLGEKGKRVNIIQSAEFKISPATEDARDVKVADFVQTYFDNMSDFVDNLVCLQDAVGKGYSALETKWDVSDGQAMPAQFDFIEQKRFQFYADGILRRTPLLITDDDPMGIEIPAWKTIFHKYGGKSGHSVRSGIYRVCAWNFLFKNYAVKDWVIFCEVYGMPLRLGKYDASASENDREALLEAITSLGSDAAGIISKATEIEFVEAARGKASGDLYQAMAAFSNKEMSKALLGQTLSAEVGDKGSYAAAKTHEGVRIDLLKSDITAVAATLRNQLIRPIVGFNFGWDTPCPGYTAIWEEPEDLKAKAEWVCSLLDRNIEMPVSFVRREFNIPESEKGEAVAGVVETGLKPVSTKTGLKPVSTKTGLKPVSTKTGLKPVSAKTGLKPVSAKTDLKHVAKAVSPDKKDHSAAPVIDVVGEKAIALTDSNGLIKPVKDLLQKCKTLTEFKTRLTEAHADMDDSELGELMARALMLANIAGRDI